VLVSVLMVCLDPTREEMRGTNGTDKPRAPSYFSQFFVCQVDAAREKGEDPNSVRTLYIDRDPVTFKDISLHLQGYHITPRDGTHFVKLFADAQFYSCESGFVPLL